MTACHVVTYRELSADEITRDLFTSFIRRQVVTDCWRKVDGKWVVRADPFVDDWSEEDYQTLIACLRNTVATGGFVCGAFVDGVLKGFVSVESEPLGARREYLDLSSLHVSQDMRGNGIGRELFGRARDWARGSTTRPTSRPNRSTARWSAWCRAAGRGDGLAATLTRPPRTWAPPGLKAP